MPSIRIIKDHELIHVFNAELGNIQSQFRPRRGDPVVQQILRLDSVTTIEQVQMIHFARPRLLDQNITLQDLHDPTKYTPQSNGTSVAHRIGDGNEENIKYLSNEPGAHQEFVTRIGANGEEILTTASDPVNVGTYNFDGENWLKHYALDIAPWLVFGNTDPNAPGTQDTTSKLDRAGAFASGIGPWIAEKFKPDPPPGQTEETPKPGEEAENGAEKVDDGEKNSSPLVLDLDGDGIELVALNASSVFWDIDNDGFREQSGWVQADDGLLAIDLNRDGKINNHRELFGTETVDGFSVLSAYDTNGDGRITAQDNDFDKLRVWRDLDQNGRSKAKELSKLTDLGISAIDLDASTTNQTNAGHTVSHVSTFTLRDNATGELTRAIHDIWFQYDNLNTIYDLDIPVDFSVFLMPDVRGYGELPDLSAALMSGYETSGSLRPLVERLDKQTFENIFARPEKTADLVREIMFAWAGAETVDPASRGPYIDARELHFLEAFSGEPFLQRGWSPNPFYFAALDLQEAFQILFDATFARLTAQLAGHLIFDDPVRYNIYTDSFSGRTSLNPDRLAELAKLAATNSDPLSVWSGFLRMLEFSIGVENLKGASITALDKAISDTVRGLDLESALGTLAWQSNQGKFLSGTNEADTIKGGIGDDTILSGSGDDTVKGGIGADTINGGGGNDLLIGGLGADLIRGSTGADIYRYYLGHGIDTYSESGAEKDIIRLGDGIKASDVDLVRVSNSDLHIIFDTGTISGDIIIENQFNYASGGGHIELLRFADGSHMKLDSFSFRMDGTIADDHLWGVGRGGKKKDLIYGGEGDDTIRAYAPNQHEFNTNRLFGQQGNDQLLGSRGTDVLSGGLGNDYIAGDQGNDRVTGGRGDDSFRDIAGDDRYHFNKGDGSDSIQDLGGSADSIVFGEGIQASDLQLQRFLNATLELHINGGKHGQIEVTSQFFNNGAIETLTFRDGSSIDLTSMEFETFGTAGDDAIWGINTGGSRVDRIFGRGGDDTLRAQAVNAVELNANFLDGGDGKDTLFGGRGADELLGGRGSDELHGDQGDDLLNGGRGNDSFRDIAGNDTYVFARGDGADSINDLGGAADQIGFGPGISASDIRLVRLGNPVLQLKIDGGTGGQIEVTSQFLNNGAIETLTFRDGSSIDLTSMEFETFGTAGDDAIWGINTGGSRVDRIFGRGGDDTLRAQAVNAVELNANFLDGGDGKDTLFGGRGADELLGGRGSDELHGDQGDDLLDGGRGNDDLRGGAGADTFVFGSGKDTIHDFDGDALHLDDVLWGETILTKTEILDLASLVDGDTLFTFAGGHSLRLLNVTDIAGLESMLTVI